MSEQIAARLHSYERASDDEQEAFFVFEQMLYDIKTLLANNASLEKHNHDLQAMNTEEVDRRREAQASLKQVYEYLLYRCEQTCAERVRYRYTGKNAHEPNCPVWDLDVLGNPKLNDQGAADYRERVLRRFGEEEAD